LADRSAYFVAPVSMTEFIGQPPVGGLFISRRAFDLLRARLRHMPLIIILVILLLLFGGGGYYMGPGLGYYGGGGLSLVLLIVILFLLFGRGRGRL
jgi:hypothetical protein